MHDDLEDIPSRVEYLVSRNKIDVIASWFKSGELPNDPAKILNVIGGEYIPRWWEEDTKLEKKKK